MKEIRWEDWKRKDIYSFFSGISNPFYMVTFRMDVTNLYDRVKAEGLSFYPAMIWACTEAVNSVDAFLMTVREGKLYLLDRRNPSFTDLKEGSEAFHIVTMDHIAEIGKFCLEAKRKSEAQKSFIDMGKETDDLIYYSCLPWIDLTALTNERELSTPESLNDSIPRIAWGKFTEENGRKVLGISLEVNHRFIDGVHIGRFAERLEEIFRSL